MAKNPQGQKYVVSAVTASTRPTSRSPATTTFAATIGVTIETMIPCGAASIQIPLPSTLGLAVIQIGDVSWSSHVRNVEDRLGVTVVTS